MKKIGLVIDREFCFDCKACEVACKQENNVPVGIRWIKAIKIGPKKVGENLITKYFPVTCHHCTKPPCADTCPVNAISKRADGVVVVDENLCIGCGDCIEACPFGAMGIDPQKEVASKCHLCLPRIEKGLEPACVGVCEAGAIHFGDVNEIALQLRQQRAARSNF